MQYKEPCKNTVMNQKKDVKPKKKKFYKYTETQLSST